MISASTEKELLTKVSQESLMNFTKNISKEVRLSGSAEEWRAFEYAKSQLESFGLKPNLYKRKSFISLPGKAKLIIDEKEFTCITHSMAKATEPEGEKGKLVSQCSVGGQQDYSGKVLLIEGLAIPGAVKNAEIIGAKGVIFINAEYTHEMIVSTVWGNPTLDKLDHYPNIPVLSVNYHDGQIIKSLLEKKEELDVWFQTEVDTSWRDIPTMEVDIIGNKDCEDFVLFSGHIDSWHYGAMDNGTANAVMLESARLLSSCKDDFVRNLRLVFWSGHSHGRYAGSALYCDEHWEELHDHCVLHLNIDSVGGKDSVVLTEGNCMSETKEIAQKIIKDQTGELYEGSRFGRAGDQSFWGPGVPSLLMGLSEQIPATTPAAAAFSRLFGGGKGGGFGWWWHTTEDTLDKIDPNYLERDCKIYLSILLNVCTKQLLPLNQLEGVEELIGHVKKYKESAPEIAGLDKTIHRLAKLKELVGKLNETAQKEQLSSDGITVINEWIKTISKGIVRVNYVGRDEFDHDPAIGQPPVPLLAECLNLEKYKKESNAYFACLTTVNRNVNKVNFILRELLAATADAHSKLNRNGERV